MTCTHIFREFGNGYDYCAVCGSFKSMTAPPPESLYTPDYWTHARGHSTLEEQVYNCDNHREGGKTKYEFVLERIKVEDRSAALEVGCAPGRLLPLLRAIGRFAHVVGVESCKEFEQQIRGIGCFGGPLLFGFYPAATRGLAADSFSLILGLDVFEHSHEPEAFLKECRRLLKSGGQLLLMLPLADEDLPERFFEPSEHVWIYSKQHLLDILWDTGFTVTDLDSWCPGHSTVSARRME